MFHACVQKFDVTDTAQIFLGTKRSLRFFAVAANVISVTNVWG